MSNGKTVLTGMPGSIAIETQNVDTPVIVTDTKVRRRLVVASAGTLVLGLGLLYASYATGLGPTESLFLTIAGIVVILSSLLLYFVSPAKFLRNDVSDAMCLSGTEFTYRTLQPLAVRKPAYVPPGLSGDSRTLLLVSEGGSRDGALNEAGIRVHGPGIGEQDIFIVPPGYGLMEHAKRLGATFTPEGLEDEIRDTLVNGFELAGNVRVEKGEEQVTVEMRSVANSTLCAAIRNRNPGICAGTGCPLCSFVGCMVAEGTGRKIVLDEALVRGKTIRLSFWLK